MRIKPEVVIALTATAMDLGVSVNRLISVQLTKLARLSSGSGSSPVASEGKKAPAASGGKKAGKSSG